MPSSSVPKPWRVADVTFVEIEIRHPSVTHEARLFNENLVVTGVRADKVGAS
jgi:hypothetical protein